MRLIRDSISISRSLVPFSCLLLALSQIAARDAFTAELAQGKSQPEVFGYKDTPKLPWCDYLKHDPDRPLPPVVEPGEERPPAPAPSDSIVLFDGGSLDSWQPSTWLVQDGHAQVTSGDLVTRESFGDCQLHLEWMTPNPPVGGRMNRGNSGVLFMSQYELQIFDSYQAGEAAKTEKIYPDGQAAAVYGETPPLVNSCRRPGEWQTFDAVFTAPVFEDGRLVKPATLTVFHNGVLVHLNTTIHGMMAHREISPYKPHAAAMPLTIQGHSNPLRFRNIWIQPL